MKDSVPTENIGLKLKLEQLKVKAKREEEKKKKNIFHQKLKRWGVSSLSVVGLLGIGYFGHEQWSEYKARQKVFDTVIVPSVKQVGSALEDVVEGHVSVARNFLSEGVGVLANVKEGYVGLEKKVSVILKEHPCGDDYGNYDFVVRRGWSWRSYSCRIPTENEKKKCYGKENTRYTLCENEKWMCCPPEPDETVQLAYAPVHVSRPVVRVTRPKVIPRKELAVKVKIEEEDEPLEIGVTEAKEEYSPGDVLNIFYQFKRGNKNFELSSSCHKVVHPFGFSPFSWYRTEGRVQKEFRQNISCEEEQKAVAGHYSLNIYCTERGSGQELVKKVPFHFTGYTGANCEREKREAEEKEKMNLVDLHIPQISNFNFKPYTMKSGDVCLDNCGVRASTKDSTDKITCKFVGNDRGFTLVQKDSIYYLGRPVDALEKKSSLDIQCFAEVDGIRYSKDYSINVTLDRRLDILARVCEKYGVGLSVCLTPGVTPKTIESCHKYFPVPYDKFYCIFSKIPEYVFTGCEKAFSSHPLKKKISQCIKLKPSLEVLQGCTLGFSSLYDRLNCVELKPSLEVAAACSAFQQKLNTNELMACMKYAKTPEQVGKCMVQSDMIDCFKNGKN